MPLPFPRRRPTPTPVARAARAACDSLEPRRLLATITVNATPANDLIEFVPGAQPSSVAVRVSPQAGTPYVSASSASGADRFVVNGLGGNDTFAVSAAALGGRSVVANGGDGGDQFNVGQLHELGGGELVTLSGGAGTDAVALNDRFNTASADHYVYADSYDQSGYSFPGLAYDTAEALTLATSAGQSGDVFVDSTSVPVSVYGGSADDYYQVGSWINATTYCDLDHIDAPVTFDGAAGSDSLLISDYRGVSGGASPIHTIGATTYDRTDFPLVTHAGVDSVSVQTAVIGSADTVYVTGTAAPTEIWAEGGNDHFVVGKASSAAPGNMNAINALLTLHGESGTDTVSFNDQANTSAYVHTLAATRYDRTEPGSQGVEWSGVDTVSLYCSEQADEVWVPSTSAGVYTAVSGGGGADVVRVGAAPGQAAALSSLDAIDGQLLVHGDGTNPLDPATDRVEFLNRAGGGGIQTLTPFEFAPSGGTPPINYQAFERLDVRASDQGGDYFYVQGTRAGTATTVDTGAGATGDSVVVGTTYGTGDGNLDAIDGPLTLTDAGGGSSDALTLDDRANPLGHAHALSTVSVFGLLTYDTYGRSGGFPLLRHLGFDYAYVNGSLAGNDTFHAPRVRVPTALFGHGGNDAFHLGRAEGAPAGDMGGVTAPVTVNGGAGNDFLSLDSRAAAAPHTHTLAAAGYGRTGGVGYVSFTETESTILDGSTAAADAFVIDGTPSHLVGVLGHGGADALTVYATAPAGVGFAGGDGLDTAHLAYNASPGVAYLAGADDFAEVTVEQNKRLALLGSFGPRYAVKTHELTVTHGGRVELNRHGLIVDHVPAAAAVVASDVRSDVVAARANGTWLGQTGITVADPNDGVAQPANTSVGYAQPAAAGTFLGAPHDASAVLIRATLDGDANLDGAVSFADLTTVQLNLNTAQPRWDRGDLDYSGAVTFADLALVSKNYNAALPAAPAPSPFSDTSIADDVLG